MSAHLSQPKCYDPDKPIKCRERLRGGKWGISTFRRKSLFFQLRNRLTRQYFLLMRQHCLFTRPARTLQTDPQLHYSGCVRNSRKEIDVTENRAKKIMLDGKPAIGAGSGLGSVLAVEALSMAGFDYVIIDNQHGAWDERGTLLAVRSICLGESVPMARVRKNDFCAIGRLLDSGVLGIIVPLVNSPEEARAAAAAVRFPPLGSRSMGPFGAALHGADYAERANDEVFLAVQIETKQSVDMVEEIMAVDGVDGCWVGPSDLANTMGVDLATPEGHKAHEKAILRVLEACRKTGKIPGIAAVSNARRWLDHGFLFVTATSDISLVKSGAGACLDELQGYRG